MYIKNLIKEKGFNIKDYAKYIDIPYSTLLTMLNEEKVGSAAIDTVIRICQGLNITVQDLQDVLKNEPSASNKIILSEHEAQLILNYRRKTELQKAVDILLLSD